MGRARRDADLGVGYDELRTLAGFFLQQQGTFQPFLFDDPTDNTVAAQVIGTGDGSVRRVSARAQHGRVCRADHRAECRQRDTTSTACARTRRATRVDSETGLVTFTDAAAGRADRHRRFHLSLSRPLCRRQRGVRELHVPALAVEADQTAIGAAMRPCSAALARFCTARTTGRADRPLHLRAGDGGGLPLHVGQRAADGSGRGVSERQHQRRGRAPLCARPALRPLEGHDENRRRADRARHRCVRRPGRSGRDHGVCRGGAGRAVRRRHCRVGPVFRAAAAGGFGARSTPVSAFCCGFTAGSPSARSAAAGSRSGSSR